MTKKDDFKLFASKHPELVKQIKNGQASWQQLYEVYDIYGENATAWENYFEKNNTNNDYNFKTITDKIKNIDLSSIQEHINTAQKALGIVQELTSKTNTTSEVVKNIVPRPINKIFED